MEILLYSGTQELFMFMYGCTFWPFKHQQKRVQ